MLRVLIKDFGAEATRIAYVMSQPLISPENYSGKNPTAILPSPETTTLLESFQKKSALKFAGTLIFFDNLFYSTIQGPPGKYYPDVVSRFDPRGILQGFFIF